MVRKQAPRLAARRQPRRFELEVHHAARVAEDVFGGLASANENDGADRDSDRECEQDSGHKPTLMSGAPGKFYAQISHGAPFEVFLSADDETPARLEKDGLAVAGSRFTYATGRRVLWSPREG